MTGQAVERFTPAVPALPTEQDMVALAYQAKAITALDSRIKGRPDAKELGEALAITLWNYGVPATAINAKKLHLIPKGDTFDLFESAQLLRGLLQMHGFKVRVVTETEELALVRGWAPGDDEPHEASYTVERARRSGALDEWVERKYRNQGDRYDRTEKIVVAIDGQPVDGPIPDWAREQVALGRISRNDYWWRYRVDAMVNRATRRLANRMGAAALMGVDVGDADRITPRDDDIVLDDDEDQAEPAAAPSEKMQEDAAPPAAPVDEADPVAAARNERAKIFAAFSRIPEGLWRQQWAKAWRDAGFPGEVQDLADEQLEPARQVVRCYIALAALDPLGFKADERHAFVAKATGQESTKGLSAEQLQAVLDAVADEVAFREAAAANDEPDPFD